MEQSKRQIATQCNDIAAKDKRDKAAKDKRQQPRNVGTDKQLRISGNCYGAEQKADSHAMY